MKIPLNMVYCISLICSSVWAASSNQYAGIFAALWIAVAAVSIAADVLISAPQNTADTDSH